MRKVYIVISKGTSGKIINGVCSSHKKAINLAKIANFSYQEVEIKIEVLL